MSETPAYKGEHASSRKREIADSAVCVQYVGRSCNSRHGARLRKPTRARTLRRSELCVLPAPSIDSLGRGLLRCERDGDAAQGCERHADGRTDRWNLAGD